MSLCALLLKILFPREISGKHESVIGILAQEIEHHHRSLVGENHRRRWEEANRLSHAVKGLMPLSAWVYKRRKYIEQSPRLLHSMPLLIVVILSIWLNHKSSLLLSPICASLSFLLIGWISLAIIWWDIRRDLRTPKELIIAKCKQCNDREATTASGLCWACFHGENLGRAYDAAIGLINKDEQVKAAGLNGQLAVILADYKGGLPKCLEEEIRHALARIVEEKWTYDSVLPCSAKEVFKKAGYGEYTLSTVKLSEIKDPPPSLSLISYLAREGKKRLEELKIPHDLQCVHRDSKSCLQMDVNIGVVSTSIVLTKNFN